MRQTVFVAGLALAAGVVGCGADVAAPLPGAPPAAPVDPANEPRFRGWTLSAWLAALDDRDPETQLVALGAIQGFGPEAAAAADRVYALWIGGTDAVKAAAADALVALGPAGAERLRDALQDRDRDVQIGAIVELDRIPGNDAVVTRGLVRVMVTHMPRPGEDRRAMPAAMDRLRPLTEKHLSPRGGAEDEAFQAKLVGIGIELLDEALPRTREGAVLLLGSMGKRAAAALPRLKELAAGGDLAKPAAEAVAAIESGKATGMFRSRIGVNESAAIGTLRSVCVAQFQFQAQAVVDQDGDGTGEFGWLGELSGTAKCRASEMQMNASPFIAAILGVRDASGVAQKSGYCFRVYLPGSTGHLTEGGGEASEPADEQAANNQEVRWICYAWPNERGVSGNRAFMVNQQGEVITCPNEIARYSGPSNGPRANAALDPDGPDPDGLNGAVGLAAAGLRACDGEAWAPAGS